MALNRIEIRNLLKGATLQELMQAASEEHRDMIKEAEQQQAGSIAPVVPQPSWNAAKTFLLDGTSVGDIQGAYMLARTALLSDKRDEFATALLLLYKACRAAFIHLEI